MDESRSGAAHARGGAHERAVQLRDGATIWTATSGTGPPVVCCHGGPGLWDYLGALAALIEDVFTVVRFDQRGCGRSSGSGPFTIAQAVDDLDQIRAALGFGRWGVIGHSWGAELALRYAIQSPERTTGIVYIAGIGAGEEFRDEYVAERDRRLGADLGRWQALGKRARTPAEEREWCRLQWRPDFSPSPAAAAHAAALWRTRPAGTAANADAARELWADRDTENLLTRARGVRSPVTMLFGADDPRPWSASNSLFEALPNPDRIVLAGAGHAPWVEQAAAVRASVIATLQPAAGAPRSGECGYR